MKREERLHIAEYTLDALKKAGVQKAACGVSTGFTDEINAEAGQMSLMRTLFNTNMSIKVIKDGKKSTININQLEPKAVDDAIAECIAMADSAVPDEAEEIAEKIENKTFETGVFDPDKGKLYDRSAELLDAVRSEFPKIMFESLISAYTYDEKLYINTNGVMFEQKSGKYGFGTMFSGKDGEKSSSFNGSGMAFTGLDKPFLEMGLTRTLFEESIRQIHTKQFDGKKVGRIIITPSCLGDFIDMALSNFITDSPLIDGTSIWKDKLGERVSAKGLSIKSAPLNTNIVCGEMFNSDGYENHDMDILKDGVLKSFLLTLYGARKTGKPRAMNYSQNFVVDNGDKNLDELISGIDKGLIVGRFSGGRPGASGDFSGVAKNSFLIENGKVSDAVSETMISGNLEAMFNNLVGITKEFVADGHSVLPWCCFDGITMSGS